MNEMESMTEQTTSAQPSVQPVGQDKGDLNLAVALAEGASPASEDARLPVQAVEVRAAIEQQLLNLVIDFGRSEYHRAIQRRSPSDHEPILDDFAKALRAALQGDALDAKRLYEELLYAVGNKYPGESRHETALRYIREREALTCGPAKQTGGTLFVRSDERNYMDIPAAAQEKP